ncbi:hypothetical protein [Pseudomonas arsenicoxydans]|uniref:Uncharacterized protein n=1 Tax=Pseudomonas arsenicoxydans TaxID=702115 RepID=A0A4P6FY56_9PSED|nr:hypothetical protein [Pseudomonas arsenicoxydans]QAY83799.1 hypothetical protein CUN61_07305 [Pseudomonas arsenicoxydans]
MKYEELVANDQQIPSINSQLCQLDNTEGVEVSSLAKLAENARVQYQLQYYGATAEKQKLLQDQLNNANNAYTNANKIYESKKNSMLSQLSSIKKDLYSISDEGIAESVAKAEAEAKRLKGPETPSTSSTFDSYIDDV